MRAPVLYQTLHFKRDRPSSLVFPPTADKSHLATLESQANLDPKICSPLEIHHISQNRLAEALEIGRFNVYRWLNEIRDPTAETVVDIAKALKGIEPAAARGICQAIHRKHHSG